MVYCRGCGKEIHNTAPTCPSCGAPQAVAGAGKSKIVAALLSFFLGGLGVHRFYLGQWWGVFYLLFCWTLIPGLVALIETIVFLATSDESWNAKYNNGMPSGSSGAAIAIAVVVAVFGGIFIIGILAAVSIPAYQDYTVKAKMVGVEMDGRKITSAFTEYYQRTGSVPANIETMDVKLDSAKYVNDVDINQKNGVIRMSLSIPSAAGKHLVFVPHVDEQKNITWTCGSDDLPVKYLSKECRNQ